MSHIPYMPPHANPFRSASPAPAVNPHSYQRKAQPQSTHKDPSNEFHPNQSENGYLFARRSPSPRRSSLPTPGHTRENGGLSEANDRLQQWLDSTGSPAEPSGSSVHSASAAPDITPLHRKTTSITGPQTHLQWPKAGPEQPHKLVATKPSDAYLYQFTQPHGRKVGRGSASPHPDLAYAPSDATSSHEPPSERHWYADDENDERTSRRSLSTAPKSPTPSAFDLVYAPSDTTPSRGPASESHWDADDENDDAKPQPSALNMARSNPPTKYQAETQSLLNSDISSRGPASESHWDADNEEDDKKTLLPTIPPDSRVKGYIQHFQEMGFPLGQVMRCLSASNNLPDLALEYLLTVSFLCPYS